MKVEIDIRHEIENFLSSLEGIDFSFMADSNTFGRSVYYRVARPGELYDNYVKVRFSDHSISNAYRMAKEVTFYGMPSEWRAESIYYALGFEGYEFQPTKFTEVEVRIQGIHLLEEDEILEEYVSKKGNTMYVVRRKKGTHFMPVKVN